MDVSGYRAKDLARVCNVCLATARRWKRTGKVPRRYHPLLELAHGGDLGAVDLAWRGWTLHGATLINPDGEQFHIDEVRAIRLREQLAAELQRRLNRVLERLPRPRSRELVIRVAIDHDDIAELNARAVALALEESPH